MRFLPRWIRCWACFGIFLGALFPRALAKSQNQAVLVHGLWVWRTFSVLEEPQSKERLRDFCQSQGINEVYVSVSGLGSEARDSQAADLIALLHQSDIRVEALFGDADADRPGRPRKNLLDLVRGVVEFNRRYPRARFDGIHLDVEPQQRPENKDLRFLPNLVDMYRQVRKLATRDHMMVNADIPTRLLRADRGERKKLFSSLPRLTLMLYEVSGPNDGQSAEQKADKLRQASRNSLNMAYLGLRGGKLAKLSIALNTPDYGDLLPAMLRTLDDAHRSNPHYLGWARHSYNDYLRAAQ